VVTFVALPVGEFDGMRPPPDPADRPFIAGQRGPDPVSDPAPPELVLMNAYSSIAMIARRFPGSVRPS
jgi:hypothetical protein